jgi:transcriptional regulator with XRE-family HTH domain
LADPVQRLRKKSPNPTDQHVGNRVRMRRVMLNLTQTELADELGLSFQQVQKYEKGTNRIGASRLQDIARIRRVPAAFFFEAVAELPPSVSKDERLGELTDFMATRDDRVTTYKTYHGTHRGGFLGVAPTGRKIQFETVDVMRVRNGKITEHWGVANLFSLMQQLGAWPAKQDRAD